MALEQFSDCGGIIRHFSNIHNHNSQLLLAIVRKISLILLNNRAQLLPWETKMDIYRYNWRIDH